MSIDITLTTVTDRIVNPDGDNGYGAVHLRPNQAFNYDDGASTVEVSTEKITVLVKDGQLQSALTVHPTKDASHNVETFYVVEYDIDGEQWKEYFSISNTPTTLEWGDITRVLENQTTSDAITAHEAKANPHTQYLRHDATYETSPGASTEHDGKGPGVRALKATGKIDSSFLNAAANPTNDDQVVVEDSGFNVLSGTDLDTLLGNLDTKLNYTPDDTSDWDGSTDPGDFAAALDQLASRVAALIGFPEYIGYKQMAANFTLSTSYATIDNGSGDELQIGSLETGTYFVFAAVQGGIAALSNAAGDTDADIVVDLTYTDDGGTTVHSTKYHTESIEASAADIDFDLSGNLVFMDRITITSALSVGSVAMKAKYNQNNLKTITGVTYPDSSLLIFKQRTSS